MDDSDARHRPQTEDKGESKAPPAAAMPASGEATTGEGTTGKGMTGNGAAGGRALAGADAAGPFGEPAAGPTLGEMGLQQFAPYLMNRIMGRYNQTLREQLARHGISTPKMRALAVLSVVDGLKINDLAVYAVIEQSTLSRALDAMEEEGLIRRKAAAGDSRVRNVFITPAGKARFDAVWPTMRASYQAMFEGIDEEERRQFTATLHKILRNIRHHDF